MHLRWSVEPLALAGDAGLATLTVNVTDGLGGTPLRLDGGQIYAWLQRRRAGLLEAEQSCDDRVKALTGQGLGQRADIDLNDYRLVTLNTDRTLAVINPFVALSGAKLESIVELPGDAKLWLQVPERSETWIALTDPPRLVAFDLQARRIARTVDLPAPAGALAFDLAAQRLWMTLPGVGALATFDLATPDASLAQMPAAGVTALFTAPRGNDELAPAFPGVVSLHDDGSVVLHQPKADKSWRLNGPPAAAGYSGLARRLLVVTRNGELAWLDPATADGTVERHLPLGHPVTAMAVFDAGRRALLLGGGRASIVDLAQATVTLALEAPPLADAVVITERFAFAVSAAEGRATLWSRADLRDGKTAPISVQLGRAAPDAPAPTAAITVPAPDGDGLLIANPTDGTIYRYNEGMMAPSGSFSNYRRAAVGLQVFDPSVREVKPGAYRGTFRYSDGGGYTLVLAGTGPRFAACATVQLAPTARAPSSEKPKPKPAFVRASVPEGADPLHPTIEVRLDQRGAHEGTPPLTGVGDLTLLVFDRHSGWQGRAPLRERASGRYVAELSLPRPGRYDLLASSASSDIPFVEGFMGAVPLGGAQP